MKVLIVYVSAVSGHRQAARAIKQAFEEKYPWVNIKEENLFRHGNPFVTCSLDSLYYTLIKITPWFWNVIWDSREVYILTYLLRNILYRMNYHRFYREVIKPFGPDVVICTHSLSCAICSVIKHDKKMDFLLVAVPTDFHLNPYWFYENVDLYFLPQSESKLQCLKRGIPSHKLWVTGIPISLQFSEEKNKNYLRKKWRVDDGLFTVLVMGGGQGLGAIEEVVSVLSNSQLPLQIMVVTGTNRKLKKNLERLSSKLNFPFRVYGYVREIDELMEISDLLITKPGGLTTAEALSKALPMIVVDSIAGQERKNKEFLLKRGLAFELNGSENLISLIKNFIENGFNKALWEEKTKQVAKVNSSREIVTKLVEVMRGRGEK